ncbi:radical SAM protein [Streptomyces sp. GD-15H]
MDSPFGLLAELTYRCPLACPYCSNPLNMAGYQDELSTDEWRRVLAEAGDLGVLQCHLSGGEPLLRRDLVEIVADAHDLGLYTNLITSALGFSRPRAEQLRPPAWTTCRSASRPKSRPCPTGSPGSRPSGARSRRWAWSRSWAGRSP